MSLNKENKALDSTLAKDELYDTVNQLLQQVAELQANSGSGGSGTLEEVLTAGNDAGGLNVTNLGTVNGVKVYVALLTQTGTNAPVATVLKNDIGDIVWSRSSQGYYLATLAGAFPQNKTAMFVTGTFSATCYTTGHDSYVNDDQMFLAANDSTNDVYVDGNLKQTPVEIRVYP